MSINLVAKIIATLLTVWATYTAISTFFGINFYFPFRLAESEPIAPASIDGKV